MQALILAGGKGTRLRPYTTVLPKPLMPIGDMPILEIILRQLRAAGINSVILAVGYMGQLFQAFFADGERYGMKIHYSFEDKPLGTAGPIALTLGSLNENFLVMNGDLLTTLDYAALLAGHERSGAAATIAVHQRQVNIDFGVIQYGSDGRLAGYREKPSFQYDVSMGINVLNRSAVSELLVPGQHLDIPALMVKLTETGRYVNCVRQECEWLDIGRIDDYQIATELFERDRQRFLPNGS
jgi:NDP-sugar pyrophosphorylase family protein